MNIIMETRNYWEENGNSVKYDNYNSNDGFGRAGEQLLAPPSEDEAEYPPGGAYLKKGKVSRQDPMSHRIIEKRRRDRMNNCLADLSRLIPPEYLKKGRGRVEKTEIIEMAIRHLKYLQDRVDNTNVKREDHFRAGYQDAVAEVLRFLVESHGYGPADGLCVQLAAHMQRHCEHFTKGVDKPRSHPGSSSETNSSSGSSHGYVMQGVIQTPVPPRPFPADTYERPDYPLNDRVTQPQIEGDVEDETMPLDGRRNREPTLREVRKPEHDDYLHSYKFKNSIERRFSRSQDTEAVAHTKQFAHKRRRALKPAESCSTSAPSTTSASGSNEDAQDTSPQDTSSESPHHHHFDNPPPAQYVPVFALNAHGKYYVPISVDYACIARHLGAYDMLESRAAHLSAPLHPVTIHVNFQPCLNYHVKREATDTEWRPA